MPIEKIKSCFSDPDLSAEEIESRINALDHFDLARRLHELDLEEKLRIFHALAPDIKRQELLYETDQDSRLEIQEALDPDYLATLLKNMAEDEATDILQEHDEETREEILEKMGPKDAGIIKDLITYGEETAGGLMVKSYNRVQPHQTAAEVLMKIKKEAGNDSPPYFYVIGGNSELLGFFKLRDLLSLPPNARAADFMTKDPPSVFANDPCEKVAHLMDHAALSTIPVVDEKNVMQGIVTFDDVIREMQDIASEDIFTMVGTAKVDPFAKRTIRKVYARAPWLITTFVGGLVSAFLLATYQTTLAEFATIILFIPFVLGLAGNVGIQGATVIVRGLATGDIQVDNLNTVVRSEMLVGIANGVIFGVLCGGIITFFAGQFADVSPYLGLTVGTGIIFAVAIATLIGSLTPILFLKWGIDPAISTGPFVTVANDIIGLFIYLATAAAIFSAI